MKDPFADNLTAQPVVRKLLEKDVQSRCVDYARGRGWWARKFSSPANMSLPDYIFGKAGCTVFVEFKRPGGKPTDNQIEEHKLMAAAGLMVHVIDDVPTFKALWSGIESQIARGVYVKP